MYGLGVLGLRSEFVFQVCVSGLGYKGSDCVPICSTSKLSGLLQLYGLQSAQGG